VTAAVLSRTIKEALSTFFFTDTCATFFNLSGTPPETTKLRPVKYAQTYVYSAQTNSEMSPMKSNIYSIINLSLLFVSSLTGLKHCLLKLFMIFSYQINRDV
jgi:hypothetical protein